MAGSGWRAVGLRLALVLLAFLSGSDTKVHWQHDEDIPTSSFPKNLKQIMKLLDNRIQFLNQKDLVNGQDNKNNQDNTLAVRMNRVTATGSFSQKHKHLLSEDSLPEAMLQLQASKTNTPTTQNPFSDDSSPEGDAEKEKALDNILEQLDEKNGMSSTENTGENSLETGDEFNIVMNSLPEDSHNVQTSSGPPTQPFKETHVTNLRTEVTNEENDAKRFEFFEKYEGIQGRKKAKAEDLKDLLKHIILASVAITGFILTVIVLVHIYRSLFLKKEQEPVVPNSISKEDNPEATEAEQREK